MITAALLIAGVILAFVFGGRALEHYLGTHVPIDLDALDHPRLDRADTADRTP